MFDRIEISNFCRDTLQYMNSLVVYPSLEHYTLFTNLIIDNCFLASTDAAGIMIELLIQCARMCNAIGRSRNRPDVKCTNLAGKLP